VKPYVRNVLAAGAAAPLLFGCGAGEQQPSAEGPQATGTYSTKLYPNQQDHVRQNFNRDVAYWKSHGVGKMASTKLVILSGLDASFNCPLDEGEVTYKANSMTTFCASKNTVIFTGITLHIELSECAGQQGADYTLDHEVGNAVQFAKGDLTSKMLNNKKRATKLEAQAACLAGVIAKEFDQRSIAPIHDYLATLDNNPGHPTHQAPAYMQGVNTGNCDNLLR